MLPWIVPFALVVVGLGLRVGARMIAPGQRPGDRAICLAAVAGALIAAGVRVTLHALGVPADPTPTPALWLGLVGLVLMIAAVAVPTHHTLRSLSR